MPDYLQQQRIAPLKKLEPREVVVNFACSGMEPFKVVVMVLTYMSQNWAGCSTW